MQRIKLKYQFVPIIFGLLLVPIFTIVFLTKESFQPSLDPSYVNEAVIEDTVPVINATKKVINPYLDPSVTIGKSYYDYQAEEEQQLKSITVHDNTYIQNSGIDYINDNVFEVVSVLEGTVITVKDDEIMGKIVEIKHNDEYISSYQSLSEISVKKGDLVTQGQVIGKSGTNELDKEMGNHLHFEVYNKGQTINPDNYLNKEISIKEDN